MSKEFESNNYSWKDIPLSNLVDCLDGTRRPIKKEDRENIAGQYPYYGASGIIDYVNDYIFEGDFILLGEDGENVVSRNLPLAFKITGKNWVNNHAHILKPKQHQDIDFLVYKLESRDYTDIISGSAQPKINQQNLMKLIFRVPEYLPEQRQIARILTICDAVIEKTQAAIAKYKAIKQGMLHDLFTRGIDVNTGKLRPKQEEAPELYKESKLGWVPGEWEEKILEEFTTHIGDGIHTTPKYSENTDFHFINGNNLSNGEILIGSALCVNEDEYRNHFKELNNRTILYSINGTIGNIAIYKNQKVILGKSACFISCKPSVNLDYIFFFLQSFSVFKFYEFEMTGSTIKNLSLASVRNTPITIPKDEIEQKLIAVRVRAINNIFQTEERYLLKLQQLKAGLMGDLLSGRKRVKVDEGETTIRN